MLRVYHTKFRVGRGVTGERTTADHRGMQARRGCARPPSLLHSISPIDSLSLDSAKA